MTMADDNMTQDSRPSGVGPGERLQAARIQQGLSVEDVASRMHLSTSILESIEDNNFEEITAPIFVKGYLRAYARIVSLDEDEMIQQYMEYYSEEDPPISSTGNVAPELSVADARIRWTTYLVVVVLAVLLSAWWWNKARDGEPAISLDTQAPAADQGEIVLSESEQHSVQASTEMQLESSAAVTAQPAVSEPEPAATVEQEATGESSATMPEAEPDAAEETATVETVAREADAEPEETSPQEAIEVAGAEAETQPPPVVPNTPSLIAPSGSDKMRIIVNADTWADIKDSSGYQLVYDLLRADQSVELTGAAPFSVFLGNGHGVEILLNDEEVDFSSRIRNDNTARLKIGG